uniref:Uncharacterized protein n=1 Tax=Zosterops lateralis melanops TaxID=1220523 RepID=A0A8D2PH70_ZOSLA
QGTARFPNHDAFGLGSHRSSLCPRNVQGGCSRQTQHQNQLRRSRDQPTQPRTDIVQETAEPLSCWTQVPPKDLRVKHVPAHYFDFYCLFSLLLGRPEQGQLSHAPQGSVPARASSTGTSGLGEMPEPGHDAGPCPSAGSSLVAAAELSL